MVEIDGTRRTENSNKPVNAYFFECPVCGSIAGIDCRTVNSEGPSSEARSFHQERIELAEEYNEGGRTE